MFYKIEVTAPCDYMTLEHTASVLVEADNIRTARNIAIDAFIKVERATELELVSAGREGWQIIYTNGPLVADDGQQALPLIESDIVPGLMCGALPDPVITTLPEPHAQTADTGEANPTFTPSTGSAPAWLPNPTARNEGTHERLVETNGICRGEVERFTPGAGD